MNEETTEKKMTMGEAIRKVIDAMEIGERFYGWELQQKVAVYVPSAARCYVDTILRYARKTCRGKYRALNTRKSLYERV